MSVNSSISNSKAGPCSSWSSTLNLILLPAPRPVNHVETHKNFNSRRHRHPPGLIWKRTLGRCLYADLSDEETLGSLVRQRRRFVRLESLGLSGVILYEIPEGPVFTTNASPRMMTLKSVFGDPTNPSQHGMDVDDLLDSINAKVIYFPSYACTSFITGQVMSAFFQQQPLIRPLPAREGFSVDATAFVDSSFTVSDNFALGASESRSSTSLFSPDTHVASTGSIPAIKISPVDEHCFRDCFPAEARSYQDFYSGYKDEFENGLEAKTNEDLLLITSNLGKQKLAGPILGEADALGSSFSGLMTSHPSILSFVLDEYSESISDERAQDYALEKDEGNTSISTLDSGGPRTPPRSGSPALSDLEAEDASDDVLSDVAPVAKPRVTPLNLRLVYDNDNHGESGSSSDIHSALCSSSISFVVGAESEFLQEPLTPINMNFPQDQDRTPTHVRTSLSNPVRLVTPVKVKTRIGVGKENIAPLTLRSRRRQGYAPGRQS